MPATLLFATDDTEADEVWLPAVQADGFGRAAGAPRRVLVAEDDALVRGMLERMLTELGYDVRTARHGQEALDVAEKNGPIDLVITDVRMPFESGTDLVDELRRLRPQLKVLYVTGHPDERTASEHQLVKPFTRDVFVAAVRDVLSESIER